jgi:hypothetical protein
MSVSAKPSSYALGVSPDALAAALKKNELGMGSYYRNYNGTSLGIAIVELIDSARAAALPQPDGYISADVLNTSRTATAGEGLVPVFLSPIANVGAAERDQKIFNEALEKAAALFTSDGAGTSWIADAILKLRASSEPAQQAV